MWRLLCGVSPPKIKWYQPVKQTFNNRIGNMFIIVGVELQMLQMLWIINNFRPTHTFVQMMSLTYVNKVNVSLEGCFKNRVSHVGLHHTLQGGWPLDEDGVPRSRQRALTILGTNLIKPRGSMLIH